MLKTLKPPKTVFQDTSSSFPPKLFDIPQLLESTYDGITGQLSSSPALRVYTPDLHNQRFYTREFPSWLSG